jgi:rod shape-determining protein MreB and related proteins
MIGRVLDILSKDIAMDLGTANTLIYLKGKGVVLDEPSMISIDQDTGKVLAVGSEAKNLYGRHGRNICLSRPLRDGVIHDIDTASQMIRYFLGKVLTRLPLSRPKLVIAVPTGITSVEKRAVIEAADMAGAGKVHLIEEPMAAAIGNGLPIEQPMGHMVVDIGGGTTEVAVISMFSIVCSESLRMAGDKANQAIVRYVQHQHHMVISEGLAETIKMKIGSALPLSKRLAVKIKGKDIFSGMLKTVTVTDEDIREVLKGPITAIVDAVKRTLYKAPPDLASDLTQNGMWLAGGGSLLKGMRRLLQQTTGLEVKIPAEPLRSVAQGAGAVTEHFAHYQHVFLN